MYTALRKWKAIFAIYFQDGLAYRASGLIWITTDLSTAVTMPLVWASASKKGMLTSFSGADAVLYYLCMLLISSFVTSHIMWEVATEIKEGQFSTALIRPIGYFEFTYFRNVSWRIIRLALFAPFFAVLLWAYRPYLAGAHVYLGWEFWLSLLLGHFVSFTVVFAMSMLALFLTEVQSAFELYYVPMLFLSGSLFPVSMLPDWARNIAQVLPFYYTVGAPTEILIGRVEPIRALPILAVQALWVGVAILAGKVLWARGLRYYSGVGM